jgi:hypothetical protein
MPTEYEASVPLPSEPVREAHERLRYPQTQMYHIFRPHLRLDERIKHYASGSWTRLHTIFFDRTVAYDPPNPYVIPLKMPSHAITKNFLMMEDELSKSVQRH